MAIKALRDNPLPPFAAAKGNQAPEANDQPLTNKCGPSVLLARAADNAVMGTLALRH
jgi:hypothetical protein